MKIPVPRLDLSIPSEKNTHDEIVHLVEEMLALHKDLAVAEREKDDRRVYALYDLTEQEIKVVEGR